MIRRGERGVEWAFMVARVDSAETPGDHKGPPLHSSSALAPTEFSAPFQVGGAFVEPPLFIRPRPYGVLRSPLRLTHMSLTCPLYSSRLVIIRVTQSSMLSVSTRVSPAS